MTVAPASEQTDSSNPTALPATKRRGPKSASRLASLRLAVPSRSRRQNKRLPFFACGLGRALGWQWVGRPGRLEAGQDETKNTIAQGSNADAVDNPALMKQRRSLK